MVHIFGFANGVDITDQKLGDTANAIKNLYKSQQENVITN